MTVAPHTSRSMRERIAEASLVWRLGNGGRLEVLMRHDGLGGISADCTVFGPRDAESSRTLTLRVLASSEDEVRLESTPPSGSCTVALVRHAGRLLLITNLPEFLGLRGGTYALRDGDLDAVWSVAQSVE
jgi:hypothetical protein